MAEVKNAFIKSKMNKDLDSRLLPSGEYRDGQNIQVSKSEGEDVGALENALGNSIVTLNRDSGAEMDFSVAAGLPTGTLKSIGVYSDEASSNLFVFLTSNTGTAHSSNASNFIYIYNSLTNTDVKLIEGSFLNFSTQNPIYGISLLENLLFWTDNRNQPRKINVNTAKGNPSFYNSEDLISVSKYNPYNTIELYYIDNNVPYSSMQDVVTPYLPNGGQGVVNTAVVASSTIVLNSLKGNAPLAGVKVTGINVVAGTTVISWDSGTNTVSLSSAQTLSVGVLLTFSENPFYNKPLGVSVPSGGSWPGDPDYLEDKFVSFSYRYRFTDGEYSIMAPFTQEAFIPKQDGYFLIGDEDKAYRSSVVGFMENKVNNVGLNIPLGTDNLGQDFTPSNINTKLGVENIEILFKESDSLTVKVLDSINWTDFQSETGNVYTYSYQSRKPYKTLPESEIIRVYDKVPVKALGQEVIANRIVYSNFQDKHTPPTDIDYDVVVTEKSPFAQTGIDKAEQTTSSVEYPQHNVKQNRNYQIGFVLSDRYGRQSTTILSKVKPSSKTQTDSQGNLITYGGSTYYHPYSANPGFDAGGNTLNFINSWLGDSLKVSVNKPAVLSNELQPPDASTGWNGLYNGDPNSSTYNPLGWYSYKIVVKQTELEYYNVYLPGILNGYPDHGAGATNEPDPVNTVAFITILGDNINKVPKDLTEVGPDQKQFRSSVELYGRVTPSPAATPPTINIPYYPIINPQTVSTIATQDEMFKDDTGGGGTIGPPYSTVYQQDSNPYLVRLAQGNNAGNPIGSLQQSNYKDTYNILLGVFETNPRVSLLDIYYETSTSGLVTDLNQAAGQSVNVDGWGGWNFTQTEATQDGEAVVAAFYPTLKSGIDVVPVTNSEVTLTQVTRRNSNENIINEWYALVKDTSGPYDTYKLKCKNPLYFQQSQTDDENHFDFYFSVKINDDPNPPAGDPQVAQAVVNNIRIQNNALGNIAPSFVNPATPVPPAVIDIALSIDRNENTAILSNVSAVNGFALTTGVVGSTSQLFNNTSNLTYSITQTNPVPSSTTPSFTVNEENGDVFMLSTAANGSYFFTLSVRDSGEAVASQDFRAIFGQEEVNIDFGGTSSPQTISDGLESSAFYWGRNYSDSSLIGGNDVPLPVDNSSSSGRSAYGVGAYNLILSDTGLANQNTDKLTKQNPTIEDSFNQPYTWGNSNRKPASFDGNVSTTQNWLQSGTAFIKLDFYAGMFPWNDSNGVGVPGAYFGGPNNQLGVGWPTYLQYRPDSQTAWSTALDVEGQEIKFGGKQQNVNQTSATGAFFNTGFLQNATTGQTMPSSFSPANSSDVATASNFFPALTSTNTPQPPTTSVLSKVFAFGKDQSYKIQNDKFGEYRLIIKYPQRANGDVAFAIVPTPRQNLDDFNPFKVRGALYTFQKLRVKLSFGDFYYPKGSSVSSYAYSITNPGATSKNVASYANVTRPLWAREWAMEYVTQFFEDPDLITPAVMPTSSGDWFCYEPRSSSDGVFTSDNGTENSWVGVDGGSVSISTIPSGVTSFPNSQRKFAARFNATGLKTSGTAVPIVGGVFVRDESPA